MVNKFVITIHILDYLILIISDSSETFFPNENTEAYKISVFCNIAVITVCNVVFGLIINQLATNVLVICNYYPSHPETLIDVPAPSDFVN